jgi:superfamily II DNA or RNA helicase
MAPSAFARVGAPAGTADRPTRAASARYSRGVLAGEMIFVPDAVPRRGRLAILGAGPEHVDIVVAGAPYGVRKRRVPATLLPVPQALSQLLGVGLGGFDGESRDGTGTPGPGQSRSQAVWACAATAGLGHIARGRLLPTVTADGVDAWRVGPLDPADLGWLDSLARAFPPTAHALGIPGSRPMRVRSPQSLVRDFWDAIADSLVRSPAAWRTVTEPAFAAVEPSDVRAWSAWLSSTADLPSSGATLGLRIESVMPEDADADSLDLDDANYEDEDGGSDAEVAAAPSFQAVLQLRSRADETLIVDAEDLWYHPERVLPAFGTQAEGDLLIGLRRAAQVWRVLTPMLSQPRPTAAVLTDDAMSDLLGTVGEDLTEAGVEVLWPTALLGDRLRLQACLRPIEDGSGFLSLDALLTFDWRLTLDGDALDPAEIALLAEARRPLVRLRGRWVAVDRALLDRLRQQPSASLASAEALAAVLAGSMDVDGESVPVVADGHLADLARRITRLAAAPPPVSTPAGLEATLRPYQQRGVAWMAGMCDAGFGCCLADDMGLGKTVQVIALHLHRRERAGGTGGPTLVVCPATLLGTWARELARFAPAVPVRRYHGGGRSLTDLADDEVVLATYGVVVRDTDNLAAVRWGLVVADEAQHAKNHETRTARALRAIGSENRIALTGTPVENRLAELWAILDWTTPSLLGSLDAFTRQLAVPVERYRDAGATDRLAAIARPFLMRRRKTDPGIAPELPPKTVTDQVVPLTAEQVTLYEAVVREAMATIAAKTGIERAGVIFGLLTALKQICNHPEQYLKQRGSLPGRSGKLAAFDEITEAVLTGGESMLVFTQYRQMGDLLQRHLDAQDIPSLFLHGGVPVAQREKMVQRFQAGEVPVFLLSLKAGGTGLTLTKATHVVHYDRWWNPAVEDQASDRAYRIGQDRPVQIHRLIAEGTLEDRIAALLSAKRDLADAVVGSGEAWITELTDDELADLVRLRVVS